MDAPKKTVNDIRTCTHLKLRWMHHKTTNMDYATRNTWNKTINKTIQKPYDKEMDAPYNKIRAPIRRNFYLVSGKWISTLTKARQIRRKSGTFYLVKVNVFRLLTKRQHTRKNPQVRTCLFI